MSMYNLLEYSSNYSETTRSLWFYSKNEVTAFDADIAIANILKFLKCKTKLLGNTKVETENGILKNAAMLCHQSI